MEMTTMADAAAHAYLGALEAVQRPHHAYFADGAVLSLPLVFLPDIVLFPGDELPLRFLSETSLGSIREQLAAEGALLAVVATRQGEDAYGTTVRIEKFNVGERCAAITGAARQRFRLKRVSHVQLGGDLAARAEVEILPETQPAHLPFPASKALPRTRDDQHEQQRELAADDQTNSETWEGQRAARRRRGLARRRELECPAHWNRWVYNMYDVRVLIERVQAMLLSSVHCNWFRKLPVSSASSGRHVDAKFLSMPSEQQDPSLFAYWVAGNLPLSTSQRLELLKIDSTVRLLRSEIRILETLEEDVLCARCGSFLATTREIFSMTVQGAAGTFVNPGGHVFQVMTLRDVHQQHVFIDPARSTEDSWFPGYAWSITHCNHCYNHLGWQFNRVENELNPAVFFGFRRAALVLSGSSAERNELAMDEVLSDVESLSSTPSSEASARSEEEPLLLN